jgi:hypothetical protein
MKDRQHNDQKTEGQTTQWPKEKVQTTIYKTLHRKLKIEQSDWKSTLMREHYNYRMLYKLVQTSSPIYVLRTVKSKNVSHVLF